MKVLARQVDYDSIPANVEPFIHRDQAHVTPGNEYVVHALAVFSGITHLQIVDDLRFPSWKPAWLFNVSDSGVPEDWICNLFPEGDPQLIMGPPFLAKDQAAYSNMVELETEQVDRFWERLKALDEEKAP